MVRKPKTRVSAHHGFPEGNSTHLVRHAKNNAKASKNSPLRLVACQGLLECSAESGVGLGKWQSGEAGPERFWQGNLVGPTSREDSVGPTVSQPF